MRMIRTLCGRSRIALVALVVLAGACDSGSDGEEPTTTIPSMTATTLDPTTSTAPPSTVATTHTPTAPTPPPPPGIEIEQLQPTPAEGDGPAWVRSDFSGDRGRQHWLGTLGTELVLLSWRWPAFDLAVQWSADGLSWTEPTPINGLPPGAEPWNWWHDPFSSSAIAASSTGLVAIFEIPSGSGNDTRTRQVYTSSRGHDWTRESLPTIEGLTPDGGPFAVAAGAGGFAVWATTDEHLPHSAVLFVRSLDGNWLPVDLPLHGNAGEDWITAVQSGFLARVADGPEARIGTHPVYRVDTAGTVAGESVPSDSPPIQWNDDLLGTTPYNNVPQPALYWGPGGPTWYRLPTPDFSTDDEERFWGTDTYTAGEPGITLAGCNCGDYWGFLGEGMVSIEVPKGDYYVTVHGDNVTVDGIWDHPMRVDTRSWFDESTGTLTVPDPDTGETMVAVTCDEMRASAREKAYGSDLLSPPPQDLLFSPDASSWLHQRVDDLFGEGSYVHQSATIGDTVVLFIDPTGDAPTPDPPGCALGIYPEVQPFEIWVSRPDT